MGRTVSAETRRISSLILKPANIQTVHNNTSETITCILFFICGILISFCGCVHVLHTFKPTRITYMFFFFSFTRTLQCIPAEDGYVGESICLSLFGPRFNKTKGIFYVYSGSPKERTLYHICTTLWPNIVICSLNIPYQS